MLIHKTIPTVCKKNKFIEKNSMNTFSDDKQHLHRLGIIMTTKRFLLFLHRLAFLSLINLYGEWCYF